jgi:hypothetical protein
VISLPVITVARDDTGAAVCRTKLRDITDTCVTWLTGL